MTILGKDWLWSNRRMTILGKDWLWSNRRMTILGQDWLWSNRRMTILGKDWSYWFLAKARHHTMPRLQFNGLSEKRQNLLCSAIEMVKLFQGKTLWRWIEKTDLTFKLKRIICFFLCRFVQGTFLFLAHVLDWLFRSLRKNNNHPDDNRLSYRCRNKDKVPREFGNELQ